MTTTRDEAREAIRSALLAWREAGEIDPTIPVHADADGDGHYDVYGLNALGNLEIRPGVAIADTVAESTGEDGF